MYDILISLRYVSVAGLLWRISVYHVYTFLIKVASMFHRDIHMYNKCRYYVDCVWPTSKPSNAHSRKMLVLLYRLHGWNGPCLKTGLFLSCVCLGKIVKAGCMYPTDQHFTNVCKPVSLNYLTKDYVHVVQCLYRYFGNLIL